MLLRNIIRSHGAQRYQQSLSQRLEKYKDLGHVKLDDHRLNASPGLYFSCRYTSFFFKDSRNRQVSIRQQGSCSLQTYCNDKGLLIHAVPSNKAVQDSGEGLIRFPLELLCCSGRRVHLGMCFKYNIKTQQQCS